MTKPWGLISHKILWSGGLFEGGAYSRSGAHLSTAKNIVRTNFLAYLRLLNMLKTADILGYILVEAISKPKYAEKPTKKVSQRIE